MSVEIAEFRRGYLLCLLCAPKAGVVLLHAAVSAYPLDRANAKHRLKPYPQVMIYADMGSMGRARRALSWLQREMNGRWAAQDRWMAVPVADGRAFRRLVLSAADRYGAYEAKKCTHHVDIAELSRNRAAMHYRQRKRSQPHRQERNSGVRV